MPEVSVPIAEQIAALKGLRQVRQLSPVPVPLEALQDILEVARWTGSARNIQPWDLLVIQNRATLEALGTIPGGRGPHLVNAGAGIKLQADIVHHELSERIMLAAAAHGLGW